MGRTVPTYRLHLETILEGWAEYRRALRGRDRVLFDEVLSKARQHSSAASYCAHLDPVETAFLSILLEMQRELMELRRGIEPRLQKGQVDDKTKEEPSEEKEEVKAVEGSRYS